ncbi:hypothetical protein BpHYR1_007653 [Brachionus plicatilis]|uniref:Uncharacterized protein n=1 Tax=Brachionus plicatilis TaxID=10195 RepID=A0A3M7RXK9_BRAPC|nr:hypothetical protein BpHYR1_007653 [Brachionus plicatilis]
MSLKLLHYRLTEKIKKKLKYRIKLRAHENTMMIYENQELYGWTLSSSGCLNTIIVKVNADF